MSCNPIRVTGNGGNSITLHLIFQASVGPLYCYFSVKIW